MRVEQIIISGTRLTPAISYCMYNLSILKDNVTKLKETKRGFNVYCNFKAGKRRINDLKRNIKMFTGASVVDFKIFEDNLFYNTSKPYHK